jgi:hypothetical protein
MLASEQALIKHNKQLLGPIRPLDCSGLDTISAHQWLGQNARAQIHKILAKRLDNLGGQEQITGQIRGARKLQKALNAKLHSLALDENIRAALRQYQACLLAWAQGAGLADFGHPNLTEAVDGAPVHADDLATLLQMDDVGCQTGVLREHDGSVILWHAEEDYEDSPGQRFDQLRIFIFKAANGHTAGGFIYPDLLPGPTFAWQAGDFVQAIDTLHVRPLEFEDAILPNTLAWLSLYLGSQVTRQELATQLGPFQGGYSLTAAYKQAGQVSVEKVEFANSQVAASHLEHAAGECLFQTNVIRDLSQPIGAEEQTSPESRTWNEQRMARTGRLIKAVQSSAQPLAGVFRLLHSRLGGESAYANRDVKAYLVCHMAVEKTSIWVGAGAAMPDDKLFKLEM